MGAFGRRRADEFVELPIPQAVGHPVGAEEKAIAGVVRDGAEMRFGELMAGAEGLVEGIAQRVGAHFALVELALAVQPADVRVIVRELLAAGGARQVIDAAVAEMREVQPGRREPREAERRAHAGAFLVGKPQFQHVGVDRGEKCR